MPTRREPHRAEGDADAIAALLGDERSASREAGARRAGREGSARHLRTLHELALHDPSQRVRREAAAAIGRIAAELPEAFAMLAALAEHSDPGVVLQAARGLARSLARGGRDCARRAIADPLLDRLAAHPNEVVRDFVAVERGRASRGHNANAGGGGGKTQPKTSLRATAKTQRSPGLAGEPTRPRRRPRIAAPPAR